MSEIRSLSVEQEKIVLEINDKDGKVRDCTTEIDRVLDFVCLNFRHENTTENLMQMGVKDKGNAIIAGLEEMWKEHMRSHDEYKLGVESCSHKYRREVEDLEVKLNFLMEENTYLKKNS